MRSLWGFEWKFLQKSELWKHGAPRKNEFLGPRLSGKLSYIKRHDIISTQANMAIYEVIMRFSVKISEKRWFGDQTISIDYTIFWRLLMIWLIISIITFRKLCQSMDNFDFQYCPDMWQVKSWMWELQQLSRDKKKILKFQTLIVSHHAYFFENTKNMHNLIKIITF